MSFIERRKLQIRIDELCKLSSEKWERALDTKDELEAKKLKAECFASDVEFESLCEQLKQFDGKEFAVELDTLTLKRVFET